ncbi:MAG: hypothetical protein CFE21_03975 [Bacteroidetes bacterium B1(2017)]|nr:MAG: hypothetical protein CFE21_03975 [Bacteroidetes bacterium B1(2017)]
MVNRRINFCGANQGTYESMKKSSLLIAILLLLLQVGCSPDLTCKDSDYVPVELHIEKAYLDLVPYQDYSQLTFVNTTTHDTHLFNGSNWVKDFGYYKADKEECTQAYNLQRVRQIFTSNTFPEQIKISMEYTSVSSKYLHIEIGRQKFYQFPLSLINKNVLKDSILIANKPYNKVSIFKNENAPEYNTDYSCYYSVESGILKIERDSGNLELIEFKK